MIKQINVLSIVMIGLLTTAISCNEPNNPLAFDCIYGTVKDATTDVGLSEAKVYLYESDNEGGWGGGSPYYIIDSMLADGNGEYAFEFENTSGHSYSLFATKEQYIVGNNLTFVQYGNEKDVLLDPEAYIQIHFINNPPADGSDIFGINGYVTDVFYGEFVDTSVIYLTYGNKDIELHWAVGTEPTMSDTIYCPAFDTTYYELLY